MWQLTNVMGAHYSRRLQIRDSQVVSKALHFTIEDGLELALHYLLWNFHNAMFTPNNDSIKM